MSAVAPATGAATLANAMRFDLLPHRAMISDVQTSSGPALAHKAKWLIQVSRICLPERLA